MYALAEHTNQNRQKYVNKRAVLQSFYPHIQIISVLNTMEGDDEWILWLAHYQTDANRRDLLDDTLQEYSWSGGA